ncbi:MAG: glycosyltransferase, partial [Paucibacter sp.]|nr:glycosyltransferase [Roseateles sp.]
MTPHVPFFSIITPTHLRAELLRRALTSIRAQTFQDFEIIVVADAMDAATGAVA